MRVASQYPPFWTNEEQSYLPASYWMQQVDIPDWFLYEIGIKTPRKPE